MIDLQPILPTNPTRTPRTRDMQKVDTIAIHAIDAIDWSPEKLNALCTGYPSGILASTRNEPTCSYHDYIRSNGEVIHMVDYNVKTSHVGRHNSRAIGVALEYQPSDGILLPIIQLEALERHSFDLCLSLMIKPSRILGHFEFPETGYKMVDGEKVLRKVCPGRLVDMDGLRNVVQSMISNRMQFSNMTLYNTLERSMKNG